MCDMHVVWVWVCIFRAEKLEARLANQVHWSPAGGSCVLVALRSAEDKTLELYDVGMKVGEGGGGGVKDIVLFFVF
jgi:hypothetical protein